MPLTIISLIKQVPLPSEMRMGKDGLMDRTKAKSIINIDCSFGLEAGLQLKNKHPDAKLIVCSMGPPSFKVSLKKAIAMGYDEAYLLSDRKLGGSDTYATGLALSLMLKHLGFSKDSMEPFVIVAGRQTSDGDTAHVPSQVAENLHIPQATFLETAESDGTHIVVKRIIEGGYRIMRLPMPCVLSLTATGIHPRRPSLYGAVKARSAEVTVFGVDELGIPQDKVGVSGSPTIVVRVANIVSDRALVKMSKGLDAKALVEGMVKDIAAGKNCVEKKEKKVGRKKERPDYPEVDFRNGYRGILTWAEIVRGKIIRPSLELLTPARELASALGNETKVTTLLIGNDVDGLATTLIEHGSDEVIVVNDKRLEEFLVMPFATIFAGVIGDLKPEIALFPATTAGRELAPRISVKTHGGVTADCTGLEIGEYIDRKNKQIFKPILESHRPTYGESKLATILGFVCPQISTARAGTFAVPERREGRGGIISQRRVDLDEEDLKVEIIETVRGEAGLQSLFEADIIVSGGRSAGEIDNLSLVKELVQALRRQGVRAEWAVSRPLVDGGYAEYARQIGQTGKTVRPKVYIAVAISGAIQHVAGMKESEMIVAIDHNSKASIFSHSDFGIVGEYEDILPELIEKVDSGFTFGIEAEKSR